MLPFFFQKSHAFRLLFFFLTVFWLVNPGGQSAQAAIRLDSTFAPALGRPDIGPDSVLLLPDGKILAIRQANQNVLGAPEYKVTRFNPDGSIDQIFDSVVMTNKYGHLRLQPDGKILVMSFNISAGGDNRGAVARLNADGTLDASFNASWLTGGLIGTGGIVLQPDGRILVGGYFFFDGGLRNKLIRLNPDGSRDLSVNDEARGFPLALQSDGKILTSQDSVLMQRLNSDGTPDVAFNSNLSGPNGAAVTNVKSIIIQPDNKILVGGAGIARLNPDGTRDTSFNSGSVYNQYQIFGMVRQPDGKILIGGNAFYYNIPAATTRKRLTRINADGTPDNTFDAMTNEEHGFDNLVPLVLRPNGTLLASGSLTQNNITRNSLVSLNQTGSIDETFSADFGKIAGSATLAVNQPDGKILVTGDFTEANNFPNAGLARLNLNGTTDTSFSFPSQIGGRIDTIVVQTDGKILIGGNFRLNNQRNYGVLRLNQNGSLDAGFALNTFTPIPNGFYYPFGVNALALQPDGKILVSGSFLNYANSGRDRFLRLNAGGTVDTAYNITGPGASRMLVQPDGKIVVVGTLVINGNNRDNPRLNADGSFDPTFNVPANVGQIYDIAPDGKFASAGSFPFGKCSVIKVFRLNSDGSLDASFTVTQVDYCTGFRALVFQPDGRMLFKTDEDAGRLNLNGGIETYFNRSSLNVRNFLISKDNQLIVVGSFSGINGARRSGIARFLLNSANYDFDGDGKADISVFRPSAGDWHLSHSSDGAFVETNFGLPNDLIAPADFDGDGRTDISVFRPSDGGWYRLNSSNDTFSALQFGTNGDLPVPGDFDGDGRADISVYRPSAGSWYRLNSSTNQFVAAQFGALEDKPIVGDFDGDLKADLAVFRPSNGYWYRVHSSSSQFIAAQFGTAEDKTAAADYDGDGKTDLAVYRPSNGYWYRVNSSNNSFVAAQFGILEDRPAPADFDGDGRADLAVFRPGSGTWYLLRTTAGFTGVQFGANGDIPAPNAFVR
jgi:uncharacterized delta-60 repeat protein